MFSGVRRTAGAIGASCQWRSFSTSWTQLAPAATPPPAASPQNAPKPGADGPLAHVPRSYGKRVDEFVPTPLARPIGMNLPPLPGENTGIDHRTLEERRADFKDYDKHLKRREELKAQISKPYFREWSNLRFQKGKSFLAPPRLFKAEKSLYFPNFYGRTLSKANRRPSDTTLVLSGKASVVTVFSSLWAENQTKTFVSKEANPALQQLLTNSGGKAQMVNINIEEDYLKSWVIWMFMGSLRRKVGEANWDKYFIIRKGVTDEIRESIGLLNTRVGYTYLVDADCRIRWAGSGNSELEEKESLVKGTQRLLDEMNKVVKA